MNILPISTTNNNPCFGRMLTAREQVLYTNSVKQGLKALDKELGIIIHNSSVPSKPFLDTGIGSFLSKTSERFFIPFLKTHGFSTIQQEPNYLRRLSDPSPYSPISTSKNIYMIPLEKLASPEYDNLISIKDFVGIVKRKQFENNPERVDYGNVFHEYDYALKSAYRNFKLKQKSSPQIRSLKNEFKDFKKDKYRDLEPDAMYEILTKEHFSEDWNEWPAVDRNLYDSAQSQNRLAELRRKYRSEIDFYIFKQWLTEREISRTNSHNKELGISIIADTPVAFTPAEVWTHKDLFLKDLALGCPPDYFSTEGQRWGFPIINPKTLFNKNGSLGKGGEFLKQRYESIFKSSPGGVRIDHLIGLIDPFVYLEKEAHMTESNSGRLYSSPEHPLLRQYARKSDEEYSAIFEKIIFPAAKKFGIAKDKIICEDLGYVTDNVKKVIEKYNLTGLSVTQFGASGVDSPAKNVIMPGSHDNQSFIEYTDDFFRRGYTDEGRDYFMYKTHILGSDTVTPRENVDEYRESLRSDKKNFMSASFAELFTSPAKKVQIFFTDFFGIGKTYNVPGTKKDCWTLRAPSDYEWFYHENLTKGLGINLPELISRAIRQKGENFSSKYEELLALLDSFTQILKQ